MSLLSLNFEFIKYSRVPAMRNALKAYEEDRLNDALEIIHASQGDLALTLPDTRDLFALIQESRGFVDALADAIETFQNFPHLASGYNRASEIYMQKGQGLHATEVYEAGLKAIGKNSNPEQRLRLQNHRHEMELKYRDFIALLPVEITKHIFQRLADWFCVKTCTEVSTAWLLKAAQNISSVSAGTGFGPAAVVVSRLWEYIDELAIRTSDASYLVGFFGGLRKEPFVGKWKTLLIGEFISRHDDLVDLRKIMVQGLTRISQSLAFLTVDTYDLISPMDLLAACPNLASLEYRCSSLPASVQKTIPLRDKLTSLILCTNDSYQESFARDLQNIIKATPNVRFAKLQTGIPDLLRIVPQHWRKLREIYMDTEDVFSQEDQILEGENYLDMRDTGSNLSELYEYICQERMRLSRLALERETTMLAEITPVQFPVLKYLSIDFYGMDKSLGFAVVELIRGSVEVLEELVLIGTVVPPETYEVLARIPRLERLTLCLAFFAGLDVYLDHLASPGESSPLRYITIHDSAFDDNQRTILATRIPTLKEVFIWPNLIRDKSADTWILPLLEGLVHSKSKVERISIPEYAATTRVLRTLSNLSELRQLEVFRYFDLDDEWAPCQNDYVELLLSRNPPINVVLYEEADRGNATYCYLQEQGML